MVALLRQRAAVVGAFDPTALLPEGVEPSLRRRALALFAADCREVAAEGATRWLLNEAVRRETLAGLYHHSSPTAIKDTIELTKHAVSDRRGRYLQDILRGISVAPESLDGGELGDLHAALELVRGAGVPIPQESRPVRREIYRRRETESLDRLTHGFVGRQAELDTLFRFAITGSVDGDQEAVSAPIGTESRVRALLVTGIGGIGKSALLARFVMSGRAQGNPMAAPVIVLDFDQPALATADVIPLLLEFSRQLGAARPELDDRLADFRGELRKRTQAAADLHGYAATSSLASGALSGLSRIVSDSSLNGAPVILVLDTFEEVMVRGKYETESVFTWLDGLQREAGLGPLRVVISGRAGPGELVADLDKRIIDHIKLDELERATAVHLLRSLDLPEQLAQDLVDTFGGNPLVIRILGQFYRQKGEASTRALLPKDGGGSHMTGVFAQQFLYSRILDRISDDQVRALAHPGLVLRRVTADVIATVLAGPCGLGHISDRDAENLFQRLAGQIWLVTRSGPKVVRHRTDLRRLMLDQMLGDPQPKWALAIAAIHQGAVAYYERRADPDLSDRDQRLEAAYHRLFLETPSELAPEVARDLMASVGGDLPVLPAGSRAVLKFLNGQSLSADEIALLPGQMRLRAISERAKEKLKRGRSAEVLLDAHADIEPITVGVGSVPSKVAFGRPTVRIVSRGGVNATAEQVEAMFLECQFEGVIAASRLIVRRFILQVGRNARSLLDSRNLTAHPLWRAGLSILSCPAPGKEKLYMTYLIGNLHNRSLFLGKVRDETDGITQFLCCVASIVRYDSGLAPQPGIFTAIKFRRFMESGLGGVYALRVCVLGYFMRVGLADLQVIKRDVFDESRLYHVNCALLPFLMSISRAARVPYHGLLLTEHAWFLDKYEAIGYGVRMIDDARRSDSRAVLSLSEFNSISARVQGENIKLSDLVKVFGPAILSIVFRGMTPELHGPITTALTRAIPQGSAGALVEAILPLVENWPRELAPAAFVRAVVDDPGRWYATLVDFADRCMVLGPLLDAACGMAGEEIPLADVTRLYHRYNELLHRGIEGVLG